MEKIRKRIGDIGLVPVVVIDDASKAIDTAKALLQGGVGVMEITLRTAAGLEAIHLVATECPEMLVGAGTVLTLEQCKEAIANGARFIVSPGFDPEIVDYCMQEQILICPGCVTPTEITAARKKGLSVLKFFPANIYGGLKAMKALAGPFGGVQFIPTGGIDLSNLEDYINSIIFAIGGGWLCSRDAINNGEFDEITQSCSKSVDVLLGLKDASDNSITLNELMEKGGKVVTKNRSRLAYQLVLRGFQVDTLHRDELHYVKSGITIII